MISPSDGTRAARVLVIDDSALMRHMIRRILADAGFDIVGLAVDGVEGLEKIKALQPDVVTLDIEMPRMDGLTMLRRLMADNPLPVVMISTLTQRDAPAAIEALSIGAVDVVGKPDGIYATRLSEVAEELVYKVKAAASARVVHHLPDQPVPVVDHPRVSLPAADERFGILVIGSSAGGPKALSTLIPALPATLPVPVVVVQHMPPGFTTSLAKRLDDLSPLAVAEARAGHIPRAGEVWIAPGGYHLRFDGRGRLQPYEGPPHLGVRPGVDLTLESAVTLWGSATIAVILTGMGKDGTRGARTVKKAGGQVFTQSEATCVVYGMPRSVYEMGLSDRVVDLDDFPTLIGRTASKLPMEGRR